MADRPYSLVVAPADGLNEGHWLTPGDSRSSFVGHPRTGLLRGLVWVLRRTARWAGAEDWSGSCGERLVGQVPHEWQ
jgi:hypothetical protein